MARKLLVLGVLVFLGACNFDYPLRGAIQTIDPATEGTWRDTNGEITVEVLSASDGYLLRYKENNSTYLLDNASILEIEGTHLLQARFKGEESADGTIDDSPKDHPWLVMAFEQHGDKVIMRPLEIDETIMPREFKSAAELQSAFAAAIHRDGFWGEPVIFQKVVP